MNTTSTTPGRGSGGIHRPASVVVIGGGISGLAAAWTLAERLPGAGILVLESGSSVGGKLRVGEVAGVPVDLGAEAMLARRPEGVDLARAAGLDLISPLTTAAQIRAGGALHPLPARTMMGIPSDAEALRASGAVSAAASERIVAEPDLAPLEPLTGDVAVGALTRSRLGNEITDRLVEPLLGGVYAGRADELSLQASMPALFARLASGGSLVRAAQAVVGAGTRTPSAVPVFASLPGGLGRLPQVLAASGRFTVRTDVTVRHLERTAQGFRLTLGPVPEPEFVEADAVVVAVPAAKAARLLRSAAPSAAAELAGIEYASMAIATFAYRGVELPEGSGVLVAAHEQLGVKAVTLSSQKWPMPTGPLTVLRASIGRHGEAQSLQREDADLLALVRRDLSALFGVTAEPVDALLTRWGGGLPQYAVGHIEKVARIRACVEQVPGLAVCGAAYDGVGIPACIGSARRAADHVANALLQRGEWAHGQ